MGTADVDGEDTLLAGMGLMMTRRRVSNNTVCQRQQAAVESRGGGGGGGGAFARFLAAGELDRVALRLQPSRDLLALVALDLDGAVLHGAAGAAVLLQVLRERRRGRGAAVRGRR